MDATLIVIDSDAELARARALVDRLMASNKPTDIARLQAQARLIAAYEETRWPRRMPSTAEIVRYLMDQHGRPRADLGDAQPRQRNSAGQEGSQYDHGSASARPFSRAGRIAAAAAENHRPAVGQARCCLTQP
jgi:hypothetical protein